MVKWSHKLEDRFSAAFAIPGFYRGGEGKEKGMELRLLNPAAIQALPTSMKEEEKLLAMLKTQAALTQEETRIATLKEVGEWLNSPCDDKGHGPPGQSPCSRKHCWPCMVTLNVHLLRGELPE